MRRGALVVLLLGFLASRGEAEQKTGTVEFNRDIRPILAENCFACHGPDEKVRKADLRLDTREGALADLGGIHAITPGQPDQSELFLRITEEIPRMRMPPAKTGKKLSKKQIELLRDWIAQGAKWQKHWSLIPPKRPDLPAVRQTGWARNPVDSFTLARMEANGFQPAPEADRRTLLRRLSFDLRGLPPTPEEMQAFLADRSADAYDRAVKRLLASPAFGERLAIYWLDVVRYADTGGYHSDNHRDISPYRDYVIRSFNANMPFDRFTIEQLAGDLLPESTVEQKIASGFNRLLQTTEEGGAQPKEYQAKYDADRVRNLGSIFLGTTLGCTQCHDHKFDPFTTKEFYQFAAFFADIKERSVGRQEEVQLPTPDQARELEGVNARLTSLRKQLDTPTPERVAAQAKWEEQTRNKLLDSPPEWNLVQVARAVSAGGARLTTQADLSVLATGKNPVRDTFTLTLPAVLPKITGLRLEALTHASLGNQSLSRDNGNFVLTRVEVLVNRPGKKAEAVKIASAAADYEQPGYPIANTLDGKKDTGWAVDGHQKREDRMAVFVFANPVEGGPETTLTLRLHHESKFPRHVIGRLRLALTGVDRPSLSEKGGLPIEVVDALKAPAGERTPAHKEALARHFRSIDPALAPLRQEIAALEKQEQVIRQAMPRTLITVSVKPRTIRVLPRGNWLDDSGEIVQPNTPASLPPLGVKGRRANRLDLARWITSRDNPLTARVFVSRLWQLLFGHGIVTTPEDFGSQGAWPTHPELLDWLAMEFMESGWDIKHLVYLMTTSATYRQSSTTTPEMRKRDPYNRFLARQASFRINAEMVRDNALTVSGLLVRKIGGPSVKPYQPAGYWQHLNFPKRTWKADVGPDQYRRGLYTYWQRTFLHPSLLAFDASTREECTAQRPRSNTPLQALVLLNDPTYVEAARTLAESIVREGGEMESRIHFAYQHVLGRDARPRELQLLEKLYEDHHKQYEADPKAAEALLAVGQRPLPRNLNLAEVAAWTSVTRVLLNLHETITRN
jgi:mono/diheme cytochrome c family protein